MKDSNIAAEFHIRRNLTELTRHLTGTAGSSAHFDIIVTDIGMPDVDGYSLLRRLRTLQSGRQMLAIAVTGYASTRDVAAAMDAGFDLHVPKPVDFNTFVPMVRRLARR